VRCPTCKTEFDVKASPAPPFCSARCRQIDLGRWLDERLSVPHMSTDDDGSLDDDGSDGSGDGSGNRAGRGARDSDDE